MLHTQGNCIITPKALNIKFMLIPLPTSAGDYHERSASVITDSVVDANTLDGPGIF